MSTQNIWTLDQIQAATGGELLSSVTTEARGLSSDTRQDCAGTLFVALRGDSFDAHQFLEKAVEKKASVCLVDKSELVTEKMKSQSSFILVSDTLKALQDLAHWHRKRLNTKIIGITGSNGKTSTKEFMARIIETQKKVFYSKGSFNNHWGVPFSLLQVSSEDEVALIEMGMNHAGEITKLVEIADPDVVVCTMVGRAHIEHFGSVEKISDAKEEIYVASYDQAIRIFNLDNSFTLKMYEKSQLRNSGKKITFSSLNPRADVFFKIEKMQMRSLMISGEILGEPGRREIPVFGEQNLTNLMAASAGAIAVGLSANQVWQGLENCKTVWGRNQLMVNADGVEILFDGYNANPDSMKALIDNVKKISSPGKKIGVFGQMLEMGDHSRHFHEELGLEVGKADFSSVFFYGDDFESFRRGFEKGSSGSRLHFQKEFSDNLAQELAQSVRSKDLVVVKGSRGMRLERMILPLQPIGFEEKK